MSTVHGFQLNLLIHCVLLPQTHFLLLSEKVQARVTKPSLFCFVPRHYFFFLLYFRTFRCFSFENYSWCIIGPRLATWHGIENGYFTLNGTWYLLSEKKKRRRTWYLVPLTGNVLLDVNGCTVSSKWVCWMSRKPITFQGLYLDLCMVLIMMRHSLLWPRSICMRIDTPCHQPSLACAFIDVICFE